MTFFERLAARSHSIGSLVCVGLDPDFRRHNIDQLADYNRAIVEATCAYAACFKPNIAFYEQYGIPGLRVLEATLEAIPNDIPVICDAKRGDIGSTAEAYARAIFETWNFDAVTPIPDLGHDAAEPFLAYHDRGVYFLGHTSNPGASDLQHLRLENGRQVFEEVALSCTSWAQECGLVVGATVPDEIARVRELCPSTPLLVPGVGAQGGDPAAVIEAAGGEPGSLVVNASRSIYYAGEGEGFAGVAAEAARELRDAMARATAISP
ncbi:MAG: orotidine-5'-phosphate decarboxylase [Dehalococcoidia bacterium]|nr:orotidine-5'-phosphate decarboxylase [Dehalococcoidia bacterium]